MEVRGVNVVELLEDAPCARSERVPDGRDVFSRLLGERELTTIHPVLAWRLTRDHPAAVLVDIRSTMEYLLVGHPLGASHVPYIDEPDWEVNHSFVPEVIDHVVHTCDGTAADEAVVLLICRSGSRSREAGRELLAAGLKRVASIDGGFEGSLDERHRRSTIDGWRFHGLPWEQC